MNTPKSIALIDGNYIFKLNYMADPGRPAAERTLQQIAGIREGVAHVIVCLDAPPYRRKDVFPAYKATRPDPPAHEIENKRWVRDELTRRGYQIARVKGYEADDLIATLAKKYGEWCKDVRIVASDKDIAQCITMNVVQYVPAVGQRKAERRDRSGVKVKFGVYPEEMPLWQALVGDTGDNVPGITGVGPKKAAAVVSECKTFTGIAQALATGKKTGEMWTAIAANWEELRLWLQLVTLDTDVPIDAEALLEKLEPIEVEQSSMDPSWEDVPGFERNATPVAANQQQEQAEAPPEAKAETVPPPSSTVAKEPEPAEAPPVYTHDVHGNKLPKPVTPPEPAKAPKVTEAEFDPISRAPGDAKPLPPLPPKQVVTNGGQGATVTALAKTGPDYGLVTSDLQPLDLKSARLVSEWLHSGGMYSKFGSPTAIFSIIARGKELGLGMTTALAGHHMVEGRPSASADLIRSLAERDPKCEYFRLVESTKERATWETKHRDHKEPTRYTYDIEEASLAGLTGKVDKWGQPCNWDKRPRDMLCKTAGSKLARLVYPGATLGLYCPEEMGADEREEAA